MFHVAEKQRYWKQSEIDIGDEHEWKNSRVDSSWSVYTSCKKSARKTRFLQFDRKSSGSYECAFFSRRHFISSLIDGRTDGRMNERAKMVRRAILMARILTYRQLVEESAVYKNRPCVQVSLQLGLKSDVRANIQIRQCPRFDVELI